MCFDNAGTPRSKKRDSPVQYEMSLVQFLVYLVDMAAAGWILAHRLAGASKTHYNTVSVHSQSCERGHWASD